MITYPYIRGEELYIPVKTELEPKVVILSGKRGKVSLQIPWCKPEDADYIVKYLPDPAQQFYEITADDGFFQNLTEKRENLRIQHEPFPQIHFHPDTGWMNDPNGLFYINGEWNMFFQYNPFSAKWQNMHWKHAVSRDLIHWHEKEITLYPDEFGTMYSGSAVVDINNDSGLGTQNGVPPILLFYTQRSPEDQGRQCLAYSTDGGKNFQKYENNPIIGNLFGTCERDPNVVYNPDSKKWLMVLYLGIEGSREFALFSSANLLDWHLDCKYFIHRSAGECPGLMRIFDEDKQIWCWVFTDAGGYYRIGTISQDGKISFIGEANKIFPVVKHAYAGQIFQNAPHGETIYIAWMIHPNTGQVQTGCMSLPVLFRLKNNTILTFPAAVPKRNYEVILADGQNTVSGPVEIECITDDSPAQIQMLGFSFTFDNIKRTVCVNDSCYPYPDEVKKLKGRFFVDCSVLEFYDDSGMIRFLLSGREEKNMNHVITIHDFESIRCWNLAQSHENL